MFDELASYGTITAKRAWAAAALTIGLRRTLRSSATGSQQIARGRGFATRGVILLTHWLFELGAARVFLTIVAGNEDSVAVARRAGFVHEGTMRDHSVRQDERGDVMWFAALPLEWTG